MSVASFSLRLARPRDGRRAALVSLLVSWGVRQSAITHRVHSFGVSRVRVGRTAGDSVQQPAARPTRRSNTPIADECFIPFLGVLFMQRGPRGNEVNSWCSFVVHFVVYFFVFRSL